MRGRGSARRHGNFELDHDGILRRFSATKQSGDRAYAALSIGAASFVHDTAAPVGRTIAPAFRTPPRAIPLVSAADVPAGNTSALRNKVVFVGPTALGLADRVLTPVSARLAPDAGVTVHAAATESLVRREVIHEVAPLTAGLLAALAVAAILLFRRPAVFTAAAVAIAGGLALLAATAPTPATPPE